MFPSAAEELIKVNQNSIEICWKWRSPYIGHWTLDNVRLFMKKNYKTSSSLRLKLFLYRRIDERGIPQIKRRGELFINQSRLDSISADWINSIVELCGVIEGNASRHALIRLFHNELILKRSALKYLTFMFHVRFWNRNLFAFIAAICRRLVAVTISFLLSLQKVVTNRNCLLAKEEISTTGTTTSRGGYRNCPIGTYRKRPVSRWRNSAIYWSPLEDYIYGWIINVMVLIDRLVSWWSAMARYLRPFSLVCFGIATTFEEWAVIFGVLGLLHVLYVFYRSQSVIHQDPQKS